MKNLYSDRSALRRNDQQDHDSLTKLQNALAESDAVFIGAGAGLSTAAGYVYNGERFEKYFSDFSVKYGIRDMYSGGFYPYDTMEEFWGFWCRYIWINRYAPIPSDLYEKLFSIVKGKDYFVLTTNVDHCFQRAGFDRHRLFYTQGDYGLFQSSRPSGASAHKTYDNYDMIRKMILSEGYEISDDGDLIVPDNTKIKTVIPSELIPYCPDDGELMTTNLRSDDSFVEDAGWHKAYDRYQDYVRRHHDQKALFLDAGTGGNTPGIIKYNFWQKTYEWPHATYASLNLDDAFAPDEIREKSICINADLKDIIEALTKK